MIIGIMGAPISSENLGCMALTFSLLTVLSKIEKSGGYSFRYIFFDNCADAFKITSLEKQCDQEGKISIGHIGHIPDFLRGIRHFKKNIPVVKDIMKCDLIIDLTEGDSFSDIYGDIRFRQLTNLKRVVYMLNKPLILAPQTYGPFLKKENELLASKVFKHAEIVMARDVVSRDLANSLGKRADTILTTDVAFALPFSVPVESKRGNKVGINFSGLLLSNSLEKMEKNFSIQVDYEKYADEIIDYFAQKNWEIYLIPHVGLDKGFHDRLAQKYPDRVVSMNTFVSPIDIKSYIATMDLFIGARMHGTIAAFTAGVPCIPTAYSRKFRGVYDMLGYDCVVDLQHTTTEEALFQTISFIENIPEMKNKQKVALEKAKKYSDVFYDTICSKIMNMENSL